MKQGRDALESLACFTEPDQKSKKEFGRSPAAHSVNVCMFIMSFIF